MSYFHRTGVLEYLEGIAEAEQVLKYNKCHGKNDGKFCSSGGGSKGSGSGDDKPSSGDKGDYLERLKYSDKYSKDEQEWAMDTARQDMMDSAKYMKEQGEKPFTKKEYQKKMVESVHYALDALDKMSPKARKAFAKKIRQ